MGWLPLGYRRVLVLLLLAPLALAATTLIEPSNNGIIYDPPEAWSQNSSTFSSSALGSSVTFSFLANQVRLSGSADARYIVRLNGRVVNAGARTREGVHYPVWITQLNHTTQSLLSVSLASANAFHLDQIFLVTFNRFASIEPILVDSTFPSTRTSTRTPTRTPTQTLQTSSGPTSPTSTPSSPDATLPANSGNSAPEKNNSAAVIGGTIGGLLGLAALIYLICFCMTKRRKSQATRTNSGFWDKDVGPPATREVNIPQDQLSHYPDTRSNDRPRSGFLLGLDRLALTRSFYRIDDESDARNRGLTAVNAVPLTLGAKSQEKSGSSGSSHGHDYSTRSASPARAAVSATPIPTHARRRSVPIEPALLSSAPEKERSTERHSGSLLTFGKGSKDNKAQRASQLSLQLATAEKQIQQRQRKRYSNQDDYYNTVQRPTQKAASRNMEPSDSEPQQFWNSRGDVPRYQGGGPDPRLPRSGTSNSSQDYSSGHGVSSGDSWRAASTDEDGMRPVYSQSKSLESDGDNYETMGRAW